MEENGMEYVIIWQEGREWTIWGRKETTKEGKECKGKKQRNKTNLKRKESFRHFASHGIRTEQAVPCCQGHQVTTLHTQHLSGVWIPLSLLYLIRRPRVVGVGTRTTPPITQPPCQRSELPKLREDISFPTIFLVKMKAVYLNHILRSASCLINTLLQLTFQKLNVGSLLNDLKLVSRPDILYLGSTFFSFNNFSSELLAIFAIPHIYFCPVLSPQMLSSLR